jgi:uncharacterized membrane protein
MSRKTGDLSVADADPTEYNVEAIARLEQEALHHRSLAERVSDAITGFTGSVPFLIFHILLFSFWIIANLNWIPEIRAFDPFPFGVLTLIVSTEGVFLAIFILISQNRMSRQAGQAGASGSAGEHPRRTGADTDTADATETLSSFWRRGRVG